MYQSIYNLIFFLLNSIPHKGLRLLLKSFLLYQRSILEPNIHSILYPLAKGTRGKCAGVQSAQRDLPAFAKDIENYGQSRLSHRIAIFSPSAREKGDI